MYMTQSNRVDLTITLSHEEICDNIYFCCSDSFFYFKYPYHNIENLNTKSTSMPLF